MSLWIKRRSTQEEYERVELLANSLYAETFYDKETLVLTPKQLSRFHKELAELPHIDIQISEGAPEGFDSWGESVGLYLALGCSFVLGWALGRR